MSHEPQTPNILEDAEKGMTVVAAIARTWAISIEVFLHRNVGARYPGGFGGAVFLFVPIYACFWPAHDVEPLVLFLMAYLLVGFGHRMAVLQRFRRGEADGHSYYSGEPIITGMIPPTSELKIKQIVEPILVLIVGAVLSGWNQPLGNYLIGGAISMWLSNSITEALQRQQTMDMHDAMIEQQFFAERFRKFRGESW